MDIANSCPSLIPADHRILGAIWRGCIHRFSATHSYCMLFEQGFVAEQGADARPCSRASLVSYIDGLIICSVLYRSATHCRYKYVAVGAKVASR